MKYLERCHLYGNEMPYKWSRYILMAFNFRLQDLRQSKLDRRDVHDQLTIELKQRMSDQSLFGDTNQLENIQIHQDMTRRIQVSFILCRWIS